MTRRLWWFAGLALALSTANTFYSTVAAALFLTEIGPHALPVFYLLNAALAIPLSLALTRYIDRWRRMALLGAMMAGGVVLTVLMGGLGFANAAPIVAIYVVAAAFEQLTYSVFYVVLADYLSAVETNRAAPMVASGMAGGGLLGGGLAGAAGSFILPIDLLLGVPVLMGGVLLLILWIDRRVDPLGEGEAEDEVSLRESLRTFGPLVMRYPIVALLAAGVFLNIMVQTLAEFQVFTEYSAAFPDPNDLTAFLGAINAALNLLGVVGGYLLFRPLMARFGVARLNVVYPALTVAAFAAMGIAPGLGAAILAHVVYEPMAHSVDTPVFMANYNAVPHRFVGRVRVLSDGVVFPMALAVGGALLLLLQEVAPLEGAVYAGGACALLFLACGYAIRRAYVRSLLRMVTSGSVSLAKPGEALGGLPGEYRAQISQLLRSDDYRQQILGLELAQRSDTQQFLRDIEYVLPRAVQPVRTSFLRRFGSEFNPGIASVVLTLLSSDEAGVRYFALQALLAAEHPVDIGILKGLAADPDMGVAAAAGIVARRQSVSIAAGEAALRALAAGPSAQRRLAIELIRSAHNPDDVAVLAALAEGTTPRRIAEALGAAAQIALPGDAIALAWAERAARSPDMLVRAAAWRLRAAIGGIAHAPAVATALADPAVSVRAAAAQALGKLGPDALASVEPYLADPRHHVEEAAIDAIGVIGGPVAATRLQAHLRDRHFTAVRRHIRWLEHIPAGEEKWKPLAAALEDANHRSLDAALRVLETLGYRRTLRAIRGVFATGNERMRARAVETLGSLSHRALVQPLLPLLERRAGFAVAATGGGSSAQLSAIVEEARQDASPWLRAGAHFAVPSPSANPGSDPSVPAHTMNRLLFLKKVPLFEGLILDDLLSIDTALGQEDYLPGEAVMVEGEAGSTLYLVLKGEAEVRIGGAEAGQVVARLAVGDYFGEMALFDDEPRSASVVAVTDATLLSLDRERFSALIGERPEILLQMCRMFAGRLRELNRRFLDE